MKPSGRQREEIGMPAGSGGARCATRRIGIAGAGHAAAEVARALVRGAVPGTRLTGLHARRPEQAQRLAASLASVEPSAERSAGPVAVRDLWGLAAESDILVEAMAPAAVPEVLRAAIDSGCDVLILSAAGLLDSDGLVAAARDAGVHVRVPSGAIAGLDAINAAAVAALSRVVIETRKSPRSFAGAPYVVERGLQVEAMERETLIFEGSAMEACRAFPANVNVAAALALAGIGPHRTLMRLYAVPGLERNVHEVTAEGDFGVLRTRVENLPSENPKTSRLAALSVVAALRRLVPAGLTVGT